jgi:hypothetical protein
LRKELNAMIELALLALWLPGPPLVGLAVAGLVVRSVQRAPHPLRVAVGLVLLLAGAMVATLEPLSRRLILCGAAVLGGIALVVLRPGKS